MWWKVVSVCGKAESWMANSKPVSYPSLQVVNHPVGRSRLEHLLHWEGKGETRLPD